MKPLAARIFVGLQRLLPRYWLTGTVYRLARIRQRHVKNFLIRNFVRAFGVDTEDAARAVPDGFESFNDFFTRDLEPGSRQIDASARAVVSPVDGTVSAAGTITRGMLLQAKQHRYSLEDLLLTDVADCENFEDGRFVTLYLAPYNYHRVHAPLGGLLRAVRYVPGDLYSVNEKTVAYLPRLFTRNERLICHFETETGPMIVVFVGALNVGSISTPWTGEIRPRRRGVVEDLSLQNTYTSLRVAKGGLLGWFNMGSTVIVLLPRGACDLRAELQKGLVVSMGETLATLRGLAA